MSRAAEQIDRLIAIMAKLRSESGCPWDRQQDLRSLRPFLVEETYEVLEQMDLASLGGPLEPLRDELGDLLFQIIFHAQLGQEAGAFEFADVAKAICDKIEFRHPHVFGDAKARDAEEVAGAWVRLKAQERLRKTGSEGSTLDGVPKDAPALVRAERLTEKASRVGFDWKRVEDVRAKVDEELRELDEAIAQGEKARVEEELGDALFALVNLARHLRCPPEDALRGTLGRFTERFHFVERSLRARGKGPGEASLEEMDALWNEAKRRGSSS